MKEYLHWHIIFGISPKAKRLAKSTLKNKQFLAVNRKLDPIEYLVDDATGDKIKFHETIYLGTTLKGISKEETAKQVNQLMKDLKEKIKQKLKQK